MQRIIGIFFISETKGFVEWLWRTLPQSQKLVVKFNHASQVSDRPISLTFCCNTIDVKERWMNKIRNTVFSSVKANVQLINAAVLPLLRMQCQCKPNAERWELALKSYAEVQPDFAKQRYNTHPPKSNFFRHLISHLNNFRSLKTDRDPFIYKHFKGFFKHRKKWNRDITFHHIPIFKTYKAHTFSTQFLQPPTLAIGTKKNAPAWWRITSRIGSKPYSYINVYKKNHVVLLLFLCKRIVLVRF